MTLRESLTSRIAANGPIPISDYMAECLLHPEFGYYTTRDPLGATGDFTTAPEISQMFGEMLGLCLAQCWLDQGSPATFALVELGPGRGTLMADILRATKSVAGFCDAAQIHLVELSPTLRGIQKRTLGDVTFHDDVTTLPALPTYLVANEFFDALPIRQFQRDGQGWRERQLGLLGNDLTFGLSSPSPLALLEHRLNDTKDGDLIEVCPALTGIITALSTQIKTFGGAGLVVDYGDWRSQGDTLQAMRDHKFVDPLSDPGQADLTAHVDFEAITQACQCAHTRLTPQGVFLERLGITGRAQSLAHKLDGAQLDAHIAAHRRLTHPAEMGTLFKVIGLYPDTAPHPAGLEP
jgi:NADH dehydrogenase [ubiquinone] 1 alpha subcomplex assembly factor 7